MRQNLTQLESNIVGIYATDNVDRVYITTTNNKVMLAFYFQNTFKFLKTCNRIKDVFNQKELNIKKPFMLKDLAL